MTAQTAAMLQDAEMRLMDKTREASLFERDRRGREIDHPAFASDIVNAMAFRARSLGVLAGEEIEHRCDRTGISCRSLRTGQKEPRIDEFVLMTGGTVEDCVVL